MNPETIPGDYLKKPAEIRDIPDLHNRKKKTQDTIIKKSDEKADTLKNVSLLKKATTYQAFFPVYSL